jgi:arginase
MQARNNAAAGCRPVQLIGAACGLGGADPDCANAPAVLLPGLEALLCSSGVEVVPSVTLSPPAGPKRAAVGRFCGAVAAAVAGALRAARLPCVLGGDHACAAGTWSGAAGALAGRGSLGLVWIDAHMDSHTLATSRSGRLHGMPLAYLLGEDDEPLAGLETGVLAPRHVCLVGVRSFEPEEARLLERLGVRVFFMDEVRQRGMAEVLRDAVGIAASGSASFGVTVDLDAVDPQDAPAVATPAAGGIRGAELAAALASIGGDARLAAFELVEYCPRRDRDGRTARLVHALAAAALGGAREDAQVLADRLERDQA